MTNCMVYYSCKRSCHMCRFPMYSQLVPKESFTADEENEVWKSSRKSLLWTEEFCPPSQIHVPMNPSVKESGGKASERELSHQDGLL